MAVGLATVSKQPRLPQRHIAPSGRAGRRGSPLFPYVHLNLSRHQLTIRAPGAPDKGYIDHVSVDGRAHDQDWLPASALVGRGSTTVNMAISSTPNTHWACDIADEPPSYSDGPLSYPPGVVPAAVTTCDCQT